MTSVNEDDTEEEESLLLLFDRVCVSHGDQDAIVVLEDIGNHEHLATAGYDSVARPHASAKLTTTSVCYYELQEYSKVLAAQLVYRYGRPDYVLADCFDHVPAEFVALLACMRASIPIVPVSMQHSPALQDILNVLQKPRASPEGQNREGNQFSREATTSEPGTIKVVALTCCDDDRDPRLGVFHKANIYNILYLDGTGNLREQLPVPQDLGLSPFQSRVPERKDDLYILFTSGTTAPSDSSGAPSKNGLVGPKAVIGSHKSTLQRIQWFHQNFAPSPRVGRKTHWTFVDGISELLQTILHPPSVLVAVNPDRLQTGNFGGQEKILTLMKTLRPTQLTLIPTQLEQLLLLPDGNLACLERIVSSGEPLSQDLFRRVKKRLFSPSNNHRNRQLLNLYGQTETTGDVTCAILLPDLDSQGLAVFDDIVAVGRPILSQIFISVDQTQDESGGQLVVSGNLSNGYITNGSITPLHEFCTGDVGFRQNGVWYIRGRCVDVAKVNGILTCPAQVESMFAKIFFAGLDHPSTPQIAAVIVDGVVYVVSNKPVHDFSRVRMQKAGVPWNLIPRDIICLPIPTNKRSAAGKVDRICLKGMVQTWLASKGGSLASTKDKRIFRKTNVGSDVGRIVGNILKLKEVDMDRSFVDLGGDSVSAVTLLYELRSNDWSNGSGARALTLPDLLGPATISGLVNYIENGVELAVKRTKMMADRAQSFAERQFHVHPPLLISPKHVAVQFRGCVDANPVLAADGKSFFVGCQGGVVQRISCDRRESLGCIHFPGWMIQADCIATADLVIVSAYKRDANKGAVFGLTCSLETILWRCEVESKIITTPVLMEQSGLLVSTEDTLVLLDTYTGAVKSSVRLSCKICSPPAIQGRTMFYAAQNSLFRVEILPNGQIQTDQLPSPDFDCIGPVYNRPLFVRDSNLMVPGSFGSLYHARIKNGQLLAKHDDDGEYSLFISGQPLTSPVLLNDKEMLLGSTDGFVYCVNQASIEWKISVGSCVYAEPLALPNGIFVICTTSGNVVVCRQLGALKMDVRFETGAEIWSGPILLDKEKLRIAFGARDSRVHIVDLA